MEKYKVAIIGCGSIGASKPYKFNNKESENITTWAKAVYSHPKTELIALVDTEYSKAYTAHSEFGGNPFDSIKKMYINNIEPDIIIVSTPTEKHHNILVEIIQFRPKLIICEKPFCSSKKEAQGISSIYEKFKIPLAINYLRRYNRAYMDIKRSFEIDSFGKIFSCVCYYTRGFKRDGSHFIDLCNYWFGDFKYGQIIFKKNAVIDYSEKDPTYGTILSYEKCPYVNMIPIDGRDYDIFDIHIHTEKGKIELLKHGDIIRFFNTEDEKTYGDYKSMSTSFINRDVALNKTMLLIIDNCLNHIELGTELICDHNQGIKVHNVMERLLDD